MFRWIAGVLAGCGWLFLFSTFVFGFVKADRFDDAEAVFVVFDNQSGRAIRKIEIGGHYRTSFSVGGIEAGQRSDVIRIKAPRASRLFVNFEEDYANVRGVPNDLSPGNYLFTLKPGESWNQLQAKIDKRPPD